MTRAKDRAALRQNLAKMGKGHFTTRSVAERHPGEEALGEAEEGIVTVEEAEDAERQKRRDPGPGVNSIERGPGEADCLPRLPAHAKDQDRPGGENDRSQRQPRGPGPAKSLQVSSVRGDDDSRQEPDEIIPQAGHVVRGRIWPQQRGRGDHRDKKGRGAAPNRTRLGETPEQSFAHPVLQPENHGQAEQRDDEEVVQKPQVPGPGAKDKYPLSSLE